MNIPPAVAGLFATDGPFAVAYLDATRSTEHGQHEVEVRWRDLRAQLGDAGADNGTLVAMDEAVGGHPNSTGAHGQVLVAAHGLLLGDLPLPRPPRRSFASWSPLPHVMPYLAQLGSGTSHVVVVADRSGADIYAFSATASASSDAAASASHAAHSVVQGDQTYPLHRTSTGDWSERHFQRRVENAWASNAKDVAAQVRIQVDDVNAELVVVAGDERARALLLADLRAILPQRVEVDDVRTGGRAEGASTEALDATVHDVLLRHGWRQRRELLALLQQEIARHGTAVMGISGVVAALQRGQVDTLVLSDDPSSTARAWIGPEPLQLGATADELRDLGVDAPVEVRLDAALVRALAGSGARIEITPDAHDYVDDGVAALLRYTDAST